ncbi:MAG: hypothetical protein Q7J34_09015 [Bacteroidales bacterium]|nr:hypothetical protein [Bacteroidales bacterium]
MSTNIKYIEKLVQLYFDAQTSPQEEAELVEFFSNNKLPEHLELYRPMFGLFEEEKRMEAILPTASDIEKMLKTDTAIRRQKKIRTRFYSIAAVLAFSLLVSGLLFKDAFIKQPEPVDNQAALEAFSQVSEIFGMISEKLNKGLEPINQLARLDEGNNAMQLLNTLGNGIEKFNDIMPGQVKTEQADTGRKIL